MRASTLLAFAGLVAGAFAGSTWVCIGAGAVMLADVSLLLKELNW